jgi:hypothetical protein
VGKGTIHALKLTDRLGREKKMSWKMKNALSIGASLASGKGRITVS